MAEATVTVMALERHTYHGTRYDVGATYEADAGDVETIEAQGKAARVTKREAPARGAYKTTAVGDKRTTDLAKPKPKK